MPLLAMLTQHRRSGRKEPRKRKQLKARDVQTKVMEEFGLKKVKLPTGVKPTYTEAHNNYGNCVVSTNKHFAALKNGALRDTFDDREYEMSIPVCWPCARVRYHDAEMRGTGIGCSVCKKDYVTADLYFVNNERKARSVWVLE